MDGQSRIDLGRHRGILAFELKKCWEEERKRRGQVRAIDRLYNEKKKKYAIDVCVIQPWLAPSHRHQHQYQRTHARHQLSRIVERH